MRTNNIRWILGSGFLSLTLAACSGQTGGEDPSPSDIASGSAEQALQAAPPATGDVHHHDPASFIKRFDKNGDGKLEVSELPDRMQKWLGKADTNGDAVITADELASQREAMGHNHFARMDKNGDGAVTEDEVGAKRWEFLDAADADKNGRITEAEIKQAFESGTLAKHGHHCHHGDDSSAPAPSTKS